jgi:hypothetical protein
MRYGINTAPQTYTGVDKWGKTNVAIMRSYISGFTVAMLLCTRMWTCKSKNCRARQTQVYAHITQQPYGVLKVNTTRLPHLLPTVNHKL